MNDAQPPNEIPDLEKLLLQARAHPGGVLGHLLDKIRSRLDEEPPSEDVSEARRELWRMRQLFVEELRRQGLLVVALVVAGSVRIRKRAMRARARFADTFVVVVGSPSALGNVFAAATLVTALFVGSVTDGATIAARRLPVRAPATVPPNVITSSFGSNTASSSTRQVRPLISSRVDLPSSSSAATSASIGRRDHRFVVDASVHGWLEPVTKPFASGTLYWIDCDRTTGSIACSVLEPTSALIPPPPYENR